MKVSVISRNTLSFYASTDIYSITFTWSSERGITNVGLAKSKSDCTCPHLPPKLHDEITDITGVVLSNNTTRKAKSKDFSVLLKKSFTTDTSVKVGNNRRKSGSDKTRRREKLSRKSKQRNRK